MRTRRCRFHFYTPAGASSSAVYAARNAHPTFGHTRTCTCQLRGNGVHDWITRGCNAIELRLLVRHGVGGRGWRQHLQTASSGTHPISLSFSRSFYLVPLFALFMLLFIFFSGSIFAALASRARRRTKTSTQLTNNPKQFGHSDAIYAFLGAKREGISKP